MCGFSLAITKNKLDDLSFLDNIKHRGPDDRQFISMCFNNFYINLVFYRLSIIDLENGKQPFLYETSNEINIFVCNGEIYNYKDLAHKYNLKTHSDCKVLFDLLLNSKNEKSVMKEIDGEFAFAWIKLDLLKENITVQFCRDRFGIRPLFYSLENDNLFISSEMKGLPERKGKEVEPRYLYLFRQGYDLLTFEYYNLLFKPSELFDENEIYSRVKKTLIKSVKNRLQSERPLGALLSGGLDSSLVCGIASKILREEKNEKLHTFSIGMTKDSPDLIYARKVAEYIDSNHHEIIIPVDIWLETLDDVIKQIETYDITTIRASTAQYLLAKWIKENTDIKVLLNGDGSDEITSGYLYFYNTPNSIISHLENLELLKNIHKYDVLRVDRTISAFGLEARVPFLQHHFVDLYLSIDKNLRYPIKFKRPEKYLLRKAFENDRIIPEEVLNRTKEAFSDGCSSLSKSWYEYITEYVESQITDEEFKDNEKNFPSKESLYYYKKFLETHPNSNLEVKYWLPSWTTEHKGNPSARVLNIYNEN